MYSGVWAKPCKPVSIPVVYSGVRAEALQTSEYPSGVFRCQSWEPTNQLISQWCIQVFEPNPQTSEYPSCVFRCQSWGPANQWVSQCCIQVSELRTCKPVSILVVYSSVRAETMQTSEYPCGVIRGQW